MNLYVDADRNRRIEARDRVAGRGRVWRLPLAMAIAEDKSTRQIPREVVLRLGSTGRVLSVAAAGYDGLDLKAEIHEPPDERKPGLPRTILPRLLTGDDLLDQLRIPRGSHGPGRRPCDNGPRDATFQ